MIPLPDGYYEALPPWSARELLAWGLGQALVYGIGFWKLRRAWKQTRKEERKMRVERIAKLVALLVLALVCCPQARSQEVPALPSADSIKAAQERYAREAHDREKIAHGLAVAVQAPQVPAVKDQRSAEQKASDKKLVDEYFANWTPTGKLVEIRFADGAALWIPEVKRK